MFTTLKQKLSAAWMWFLGLSLLKKVIAIVVVLAIVWFGILPLFKTKNTTPQYETTTVEKSTLISAVTASGSVSSSNNTSVTTQLTGVVGSVYVKNGDTVTAGQTLMTITPDQASAQKQSAAYASYLSAQNNVNSASANLYSLQSSLFVANQKFINDKGIQNPTDQDKADPVYIEENATWLAAEAAYKNQQNVIAAAQASLNSASLSYAQISSNVTAPISGTVSGLSASAGTVITSSSSSSSDSSSNSTNTVGTIHTSGNPIVSVSLSEIDVPNVQIGDKATVTFDAFSGKTFTGKVSSIDTTGSVSSGVTSYPATILLDTEVPNLLANMSASVSIITQVKDDVLAVPTSAIQISNDESSVRVLKNGQIQSVTVTTGITTDTETEITSGLNEGDTVITSTLSNATSGTGSTSTSPFGGNLRFGGAAGGGFGGSTTRRTTTR